MNNKHNKATSKELLDIIVNDIGELDLTNYLAIYRIGDLANRLIGAIDVVGKEIFAPASEELSNG